MDSKSDPRTLLIVVTDTVPTAARTSGWIGGQLSPGMVERHSGFYAAIAAIDRRVPVVVVDVALSDDRDRWRLGELRAHGAAATFVVVASAPQLDLLAGAVRADLAVATTDDLPPLREMVNGVTGQPSAADTTASTEPASTC